MAARSDLTGLDGKVVVVTGAGQGLGETTARFASEQGASVVLFDVDLDAAQGVVDELVAEDGSAVAIRCDVADEGSVSGAVGEAIEAFGRIDGLVNNAGVIGFERLEDLEVVEWDRLVAVNLRGTFLCTKHVGRAMLDQGSGSIVNIGSVAAGAPQPNSGAYSPTKAAVVMLARQAAVEWGPAGLRANAVSPGIMETPMAQGFLADPDTRARRLSMVASRRFADPREVASVIAWLLSDGSSYVNGQNLEVDGGMMQVLLGLLPRPGTPPLR